MSLENVSVTANFAIDSFTLTYTAGSGRHDRWNDPPDRRLRRGWNTGHRHTGC